MDPVANNNSPSIVEINPEGNISSIFTPLPLILPPNVQTISNSFKINVGSDIIINSIAKHSLNGQQGLHQILLIVKVKGFHDCLSHNNFFISKVNTQLHADDGPLSHFKKNVNTTLQKEYWSCSQGMKPAFG